MRSMSALVAFLVAANFAGIRAADQSFRSDTLPGLNHEATLIIQSGGLEGAPRKSETRPRIVIYDVGVKKVFRGEGDKAARLLVVVPASDDPHDPKAAFADSILFLSGPLNNERWGLRDTSKYYELVGSVAPSAAPSWRREAVEQFLNLGDNDIHGKLVWAGKFLEDKDLFLQRSAVALAGELAPKYDDACELLVKTLESDKASVNSKLIAIQSVPTANPKGVPTSLLVKICKNSEEPVILRVEAINALSSRQGGRLYLEEWSTGDDDLLKAHALQLLNRLGQKLNDERRDELEKDLQKLKESLTSSKPQLATQLRALGNVARFKESVSAEQLATVAMNKDYRTLVRANAILAIASMKIDASKAILTKLAAQLEDKELKMLAEGLTGP